jgi:hypothetical protein
VIPRFGEAEELDDAIVAEIAHDLNLFEDVCTL